VSFRTAYISMKSSPLPLFIKRELEAYSDEVPNLKQMLRDSLHRNGLTVDEIEKYAPELVSRSPCSKGTARNARN